MIELGVFGGGSWATALVKILTDNKLIVNWYLRRPEQAQAIQETGRNPDYLNFVTLNTEYLRCSSQKSEVAQKSNLLLFAVPSGELPKLLADFDANWAQDKVILSAIKGTVGDEHEIPSIFLAKQLGIPNNLQGILAGPCHAEEIGHRKKTYLTIGAIDTDLQQLLRECFSGDYLDIRLSTDIIGIECAAIYKNVVGLVCGMAKGLHYGDNFLAVLVSNALAELADVLQHMGSDAEILNSSYAGDLLVTAYSVHSRNRLFGEMIGRGYSVDKAKGSMHMVAEGYGATRGLYENTRNFPIGLPVLQTAYRVLFRHMPVVTEFKLLEQKLK
ncbi:NAD(P)H-dependent glycerol-3-phosphate dehydrogenase [Olivibacter sp. CPCC 100613]|uniref:NAD(P)H-dependent glycerol-3-phosphate dehydrogenase n=1 Tax=Olivibacter sp. CPCC 100613 TaxID=3079931 RepID=UPI002FFBD924